MHYTTSKDLDQVFTGGVRFSRGAVLLVCIIFASIWMAGCGKKAKVAVNDNMLVVRNEDVVYYFLPGEYSTREASAAAFAGWDFHSYSSESIREIPETGFHIVEDVFIPELAILWGENSDSMHVKSAVCSHGVIVFQLEVDGAHYEGMVHYSSSGKIAWVMHYLVPLD